MTNKAVFTCGIITVLVTAVLSFLNYSEWYLIVVLKDLNGYHFGNEGPSPYYYQTPILYATVMFIWGTAFLVNLIYVGWSIMKNKERATIAGVILLIILYSVMYVHSHIGAE